MELHDRYLNMKPQEKTATSATYIGNISRTHPLFDGHFDGFPVFPAVGQIALAEDIASELLTTDIQIVTVNKAKFRNVLKPGNDFNIHVEVDPERLAGHWIITEPNQKISEGTFLYHAV